MVLNSDCSFLSAIFLSGRIPLWLVAALWIGLALIASLISLRVGLFVPSVEIVVGAAGRNLLALRSTAWIDFWAAVGNGRDSFQRTGSVYWAGGITKARNFLGLIHA